MNRILRGLRPIRLSIAIFCAFFTVFFQPAFAQIDEWKSLDEFIERVALEDPLASAQYIDAGLFSKERVIKRGETLSLRIEQVESMSGEFLVDQDGRVEFPLIGPLAVAGLKPDDLAFSLKTIYSRDLLRDPKITITLPQKDWGNISVHSTDNKNISIPLTQPEPILDVLKNNGLLGQDNNVFPIYIFQDELDRRRVTIITKADAASPLYRGPLAFPNDRVILWDWRLLFTSHPSLKQTPYLNALMQIRIDTLPEK